MSKVRLLLGFIIFMLSSLCFAERSHLGIEIRYRYYSASTALSMCNQQTSSYPDFASCHHENTFNKTGYYVVYYSMGQIGAPPVLLQSAAKWTYYNYAPSGNFYSLTDAMDECNDD